MSAFNCFASIVFSCILDSMPLMLICMMVMQVGLIGGGSLLICEVVCGVGLGAGCVFVACFAWVVVCA